MADSFGVRVDGVRELVRAIGTIDPALRKELGRRNKGIGQNIIDRSYPKPLNVGGGLGAKPRASATTNVLRIISGTTTRKDHRQQWGRRFESRDGVKRPYIRRAAEELMPAVERAYMDALKSAAREAGLETREGLS
jgi:hypothetical protein